MSRGPAGPGTGVTGVVLAAGAGRRFGGPKALATAGGATLLARAVAVLADGGCDPVLAVVGAGADRAAAEAERVGAVPVANPDWSAGMASSLRAGLGAVPAGARAAVVLLVDQPLVGAACVRRLVAAHAAGALAARATYGGVPGHPVLFDRTLLADVAAAARGDAGARAWLRGHPELVTDVACDGVGDPADVDTPEALAALAGRLGAAGAPGPAQPAQPPQPPRPDSTASSTPSASSA